jgi:hypothetical protein
MAPSYSGVWNISTFYQYNSVIPSPPVNGILAGGYTGSATVAHTQTINFNDGNGTDQGDLTVARYDASGFGSTTRGVFAGGYGASGVVDVVDYIEHASLGNATDFGDMTVAATGHGGHSSNTRGVVAGFQTSSGVNTVNKTIDYYTIASAGNATDFGDLSSNRNGVSGGGGTTRAIFFAGYAWGSSATNVIDYITIATTGDATDFGDTSNNLYTHYSNVDSATRSIFFGGYTGSAHVDVIEYVTIASKSNATDFGNLDQASSARGAGLSNGTIGILTGDEAGTSANNQKITIASTGNATDFGTLQTYGGNRLTGGGSASPHNPAVQAQPSLPSAGNTGLMTGALDSFIESIDIATLGNSVAFGDISYTYANGSYGGAASATRMCVAGATSNTNNIDLTIFATRGKGTDFGDLNEGGVATGSSNSTRGLFSVGGDSNTIDYITIASAGNATDFGNLYAVVSNPAMAGNTTRMLFMGGDKGSGSPRYVNEIGYVTISSTGNTTDFGDLLQTLGYGQATSSSTRVVHCGGYTGSAGVNTIQYVTTASTGNATDFGDLLSQWTQGACFSNSTRAIIGQGYNWETGANQNIIQYFTIASTGDSADFGDALNSSNPAGQSNGHGGIA